jgi:hypothetical protein
MQQYLVNFLAACNSLPITYLCKSDIIDMSVRLRKIQHICIHHGLSTVIRRLLLIALLFLGLLLFGTLGRKQSVQFIGHYCQEIAVIDTFSCST